MTQTRDIPQGWIVPPGWTSDSASRSPLRLVNAFAFAKSSSPPVDQWTHFAKLRPVPRKFVLGFAVIALVCIWGIVGTLSTFADELIYAALPLAVMAIGALFFGWAVVKSVASHFSRTGWPHLHGVGIGPSGIAFRLAGGDSDVPWESVTSIRATVTNELNPGKPGIPVLRVEYAGARVDLNTAILGASPIALYRALLFYWTTPAARDELGTTVAQQRMDDWVTAS